MKSNLRLASFQLKNFKAFQDSKTILEPGSRPKGGIGPKILKGNI